MTRVFWELYYTGTRCKQLTYRSMVWLALSMTLGGVVILHLPQLPNLGRLSMLVPAAIFGVTSPRLRVLSGFTLGLWVTAATATREMDLRIPTGKPAEQVVIGMVTGLPSYRDRVHRFQFRVMEGALAGRRLHLSWRAPELINDAVLVDRIRHKVRESLSSVVRKESLGTLLALSLGDTSQLERRH